MTDPVVTVHLEHLAADLQPTPAPERRQQCLVLLTTTLTQAPDLSRVVVPGVDTLDDVDPRLRARAGQQGIPVELLPSQPGTDGTAGAGGFSAALQNLADHTDAATASATAKMIGYPTTGLDLGDQHRTWRPVLLATAGFAIAVLVGLVPACLARRQRRRRLANARTTPPLAEPEAVNVAV